MKKLDEILNANPNRRSEYTLERMMELIEPRDRDELILALGNLVHSGRIQKLIRVVSRRGQGGIGDFDSIEQVPSEMLDSRTGVNVEVTPDDLQFIYVVPAQHDHR